MRKAKNSSREILTRASAGNVGSSDEGAFESNGSDEDNDKFMSSFNSFQYVGNNNDITLFLRRRATNQNRQVMLQRHQEKGATKTLLEDDRNDYEMKIQKW